MVSRSSRQLSCFSMKFNSVGRSKLVAVARLPVLTSPKNVSGIPNTIATMSLYWRTFSGSDPAPCVENAFSSVPGPAANVPPVVVGGFWSHGELAGVPHRGLHLLLESSESLHSALGRERHRELSERKVCGQAGFEIPARGLRPIDR